MHSWSQRLTGYSAPWGVPSTYARSGGTIPVVAEPHRRYRKPSAMWGLSRPSDRIH